MPIYPGDETAKAAFDVMMLRGWSVVRGSGDNWWAVDGNGTGIEDYDAPRWTDPFTALVKADEWYRENVGGLP